MGLGRGTIKTDGGQEVDGGGHFPLFGTRGGVTSGEEERAGE